MRNPFTSQKQYAERQEMEYRHRASEAKTTQQRDYYNRQADRYEKDLLKNRQKEENWDAQHNK